MTSLQRPAQGASSRRFATADLVDFVVVGSGVAGGSVARELTRLGHTVVLLEQGQFLTRGDFTHDELDVFFNNKYANTPPSHVQTYRTSPDEKAEPRHYLLYAATVGGSSMHYAANYWRFRPGDFDEFSRHGNVPGAAMADWPITYDDLEPYYTAVEWAIGVSGQGGADPRDGRRSRPFPLPPLDVTGPGVLLEVAAKKMGWRAIPAPMAIASRPYKGREGCHNCGFCWWFPCEWGAKSGTNFTMVPEAIASGRCELRTGCKAARVETDDRGRVTGVVYFDADRREQRQRSRAVFLCANGAETPRLLLMSATSRFPNGLANSSGMVGKHLMFNGNTGGGGEFEHAVNGHKGAPVTRIVLDPYDLHDRGLYGGGGFDFRYPFPPILSALNMPPDTPQWGAGYKATIRRVHTRAVACFGHTTSLPVPTNAVDLDPEAKDSWGLPALRVTFREHESDMRLYQHMHERGLELLAAAGAVRTWGTPPPEDPGLGVHLLGTCRMGRDPGSSVVDPSHRAHDVPNLFLVDGSSFVTSGRGQPTLTIQALAFRAADLASRMAKRGELGA
ncbi:MAG: GMC family oxidoreductase [Gemmatimonadaceae bacterium]|nr:GMC family oxidoreductase [Gemmatimonadaceae bacterium]